MRLSELFKGLDVDRRGEDVAVADVAVDAGAVQPGALLVVWKGQRHDGHEHVPAAMQRGAVAVLCEHALPLTIPHIVARDVHATLAVIARRFFSDPAYDLSLVGVTGTNGKTTVTHLVEGLWQAQGVKTGVIGTLGVRYGGESVVTGLTTPDAVTLTRHLRAMADGGVRGVAMEVSSHALDQKRVDGLRFDVGVWTNLTQDHLDYHHTMDRYGTAKARLFRDLLKSGGTAVFNADDERVAQHAQQWNCPTLGFSARGNDARVQLVERQQTRAGMQLRARIDGREWAITTPLIGGFNVDNVLAAVGVGLALGIASDVIRAGIAQVSAVPGRLQRVSRDGEPLVVVDYAHTPDALDKALRAVREVTGRRVVCVFGCGGDRDPHKRAPMGRIASELADALIVTNDNPRSEDPKAIAATVVAGVVHGRPQVELDRAAAIRLAIAQATPDDTVLIAGKGHEDYQIIGDRKFAFDDRQVARAALDEAAA